MSDPLPNPLEPKESHLSSSTDLEKGESHPVLQSRPTVQLDRSQPYPHARRGTMNARTMTLQQTRSLERARTMDLQRTHTLSMMSGPRKADSTARMVGEFRTLSIHVSDTQREAQQAAEKVKAKSGAAKDLANLDFHKISIETLTERFSVSRKVGLDEEQAARRLKENGKNILTPPPKNLFKKWANYVFGGFGSLLFVASILCFIAWKPLGEPNPQISNLALAVVLLIVIVVQTTFNAWQDYSTSQVMDSIAGMLPDSVSVLRDGSQIRVPAAEIVAGDIVFVNLGNKIAADLRFIEVSSDLKLDRSVLTGESEPVPGTVDMTDDNMLETQNVAMQGTLCVSGSGVAVVIQTGDNTVFGRIAKLSIGGKAKLSTLQKELLRFIILIVAMALTISVIVIILWAAWLNRDHPGFITKAQLVINVVSVCVSFIPEGLPACVTISLAVVAGALAKKHILCKTLVTVETLGATSVLCSDKTGTLTQNKMTVTNASVLDDQFTVMQGRERMVEAHEKKSGARQLAAIAGICNAASFVASDDSPAEVRLINGDATDSALLRFAELLRPVNDSNAEWEEVFKVNFNSKTKFMLKIVKLAPTTAKILPAPIETWDNFGQDDLMLMVKGAPDVLLKRCTNSLSPEGQQAPLDDDARTRLTRVQEEWAAKGQRVLLLARRTLHAGDLPKEVDFESTHFGDVVNMELNQQLTVVGLVGIVDPPKDDIPETVATLRGAYIRFMMVTGDFPLTAVAIAEQCGIVTDASTIHHLEDLDRDLDESEIIPYNQDTKQTNNPAIVLTGTDLMKMNETQWRQAVQYEEIVFARTTPEQKLRIVKEFQAQGMIVAMTGDGVNDAPSLKAADIGIAVASGSSVAIEAADLVLLEDFSAIVTAVERGRLVYDNLKKTILYLLPAGSFSELMPVLINVLFGLPQALSSLQMIIICVFTDVAPALSLCYESPEAGLLLRKPRNVKTDRLVDWKLLFHAYFIVGLTECLCAMAMSFWYLQREGVAFADLWLAYGGWGGGLDPAFVQEKLNTSQSIYFFTLVIMQWGNLLSVRTRRLSIFQSPPIGRAETLNRLLFPAMFIALALAFFFSYVPFFQNAFLTRGVPVEYIFLPFAFALGLIMMDEARKYCVRRYPKGFLARIAW